MVIKIKDIRNLFYGVTIFCYTLLITNVVVVFNSIENILKGITLFSLFGILILNVKSEFKLNFLSFFKIIMAFILMLLSFFFGLQELEILLIIVTMISCVKIDKDDLLKTYAITIFILLGIVFMLCNINVIPNTADSLGRYTLGFKYTTFSFNLFFSAILAYFSSNKVKITYTKIFILFIVSVYLYYKTNTLSAFGLSVAFLFMVLVLKNKEINNLKVNKFIKRIIINSPIILAVLTVGFQLYYNVHCNDYIMIKLNKALSGRLYYGQKAFQYFDITLFGQKTMWSFENNTKYFYVDSSYLNILFSYGITALVLVCFVFRNILEYAFKNKLCYLCLAIVIFLIHSVTDPQLLTLRYNPFLSIYFGILLENLKRRGELKNEKI